mmetsp:Transcript_11556/g.41610  ORF Transcript_11556/g.41610 Transcript_11556/m.41610 type:complete len:253 (+) Transcript_11556:133-891(+)
MRGLRAGDVRGRPRVDGLQAVSAGDASQLHRRAVRLGVLRVRAREFRPRRRAGRVLAVSSRDVRRNLRRERVRRMPPRKFQRVLRVELRGRVRAVSARDVHRRRGRGLVHAVPGGPLPASERAELVSEVRGGILPSGEERDVRGPVPSMRRRDVRGRARYRGVFAVPRRVVRVQPAIVVVRSVRRGDGVRAHGRELVVAVRRVRTWHRRAESRHVRVRGVPARAVQHVLRRDVVHALFRGVVPPVHGLAGPA